MTADKILELARAELGTTEFPPGSNKVKYNTAYYGREVSGNGYAWCAVFLWWLFREAGAPELYYGGGRTAYCPTLLLYHKGRGQAVGGNYQPGDVIFFNFSGKSGAAHVGLCESWDGTNITTIDGNTGTGNDANGGAVMRRTRNKKYIVGAYRPAFQEENTVTQEQFDAMMEDWLSRRDKLPASEWARPYIQNAIDHGLMAENAAGSIDRPHAYLTRQEAAVTSAAIMRNVGGAVAVLEEAIKEIRDHKCNCLCASNIAMEYNYGKSESQDPKNS